MNKSKEEIPLFKIRYYDQSHYGMVQNNGK